jgi:hypothetical protein
MHRQAPWIYRASDNYADRSGGTFNRAAGFIVLNSNARSPKPDGAEEAAPMHSIIYLVGLVVVVLFILSVLGLR